MAHLASTSITSTGPPDRAPPLALRVGSVVALTMTAVTVATFALAFMAGPDDTPYPFTSDVIAAQWPGDYLWMYPAMLLMLLFVVVIASVHEYAPAARKIFSLARGLPGDHRGRSIADHLLHPGHGDATES